MEEETETNFISRQTNKVFSKYPIEIYFEFFIIGVSFTYLYPNFPIKCPKMYEFQGLERIYPNMYPETKITA